MATLTIRTDWACNGVTPGASCAPITLAARAARVSVCATMVVGTVSGTESVKGIVVDDDVEVVLALVAIVCVVVCWVVLVASW